MKCVFMWCLLVCRFSEARSEAIHGGRVTDIHVLPSMRHVCHGAGDSLSLCKFYDCSWFCVCVQDHSTRIGVHGRIPRAFVSVEARE